MLFIHALIFLAEGMQGAFETHVEALMEEDGNSTPPARDEKRSRLEAVPNNAPWKNLLPANDKDTQQRMRMHRENVAKYTAATDEQRKQIPRVSPYPESPDAIFPGTPCYRMNVNGSYVYIFVIDTESPAYTGFWDGRPRVQQSGYWIVPHFIYRDYNDVEKRKKQWKKVYDDAAKNLKDPPPKTDYEDGADSNLCYYSPGVDNDSDETPPPIKDPLFSTPFNKNPLFFQNTFIKPYPYNQNKSEYPQRTKPTLVEIPKNQQRANDNRTHFNPHASLLEVIPPSYKGKAGIDWIDINSKNFEIGAEFLKNVCQQAEEMDYNFAQSMQGLRGTNISAVWTCTDPEYDITDRATVLAQFVRMYMEKFYTHISVMGSTDVEEVVHEALRLHEEFCKGWVHRHHRTLSPEITAASEALVGLYFDELCSLFPRNVHPTRAHLSRFLRRHPDYCGEFAHCLYHYMTSLEHMRGNRNPSYKAMSNERAAQITALRKMGTMLFNGANRNKLGSCFRECNSPESLLFSLSYVDWHYIAAQMPQHHKEFDGFTNSFNLYRTRTGGRANAFPPWQQMRAVR